MYLLVCASGRISWCGFRVERPLSVDAKGKRQESSGGGRVSRSLWKRVMLAISLRQRNDGQLSCLNRSGFSVIHESWKNLSSLFLSMSYVQVNTKQRNFLVGGRWDWVLAFEFFNRQLEDPKGRSCSELGVLRNLAKLPIPVSICRKIIFDETGGRECETKENRKQKLIEKLQIMSKLCK